MWTALQPLLNEFALAVGIVLSAVAQVFLRRGAKGKKQKRESLLNSWFIVGYTMFVVTIPLTIYAMQEIELRTAMAWGSLTFILTPLFAWLAIKDPFDARMLTGSFFIVAGIVVFSL